LCFAGAREAKDASLKNLKDVRAYTQLTILGSVPLLENDLVVRRRKRLAWLAWSTACLVGIIIMTGSVFFITPLGFEREMVSAVVMNRGIYESSS